MDTPVEEDLSRLSVAERLAHKAWKARSSAYEELAKTFAATGDESDPAFRPFLSDPDTLRRAVLDANAVAQEKALDCVLAFIEYAGPAGATKTAEAVVPALVEKCLGSARAGTRTKAIELCVLYVECSSASEPVVPCLVDGLKAKQPKAVAGCVMALRDLVRAFGVPVISVKSVLKALPVIFGHTDKTVRAEGTSLAQELYRWLGPALTPHLADFKPVQLKELNESFAELDSQGAGAGSGVQTRYTRAQQRERQVAEAQGTLEGRDAGSVKDGPATSAPAFDPFELVEPVAVLVNLPPGFYEKLASAKWKERKEEALDPLLVVLQAPRLRASDDYTELVRALAGRMTDANVACVTAAANALTALARGLRTEFARHRSTVVPPLLERLKEKKQSVVDALAEALDATFATTVLSDVSEDIATFAKHKNPQVRTETLKWLARCLATTTSPPTKADTKVFSEAATPALGDSFEPVRAAAVDVFGTLMKVVGERALNPVLADIDDIRKAKIREVFDKVQVRCAPGLPAAVPAPAKPSKPAAASRPVAAAAPPAPTPVKPVRPAPSAAPIVRKPLAPVAAKPAASAPKPAAAPSAPPKAVVVEPLRYRMSQEDADAQAESILPADMFAGLADGNWKIRLAAMEQMQAWLEDGELARVDAELVVRVLSKRPGWKDSNFQVFARVAAVLQLLAERSSSHSKACIALATPALCDKLGDIKLKKPAGDALIAFAEKSSLQFVLSQAYDAFAKLKAPKAQADSIAWVEAAIRDFGLEGIAVRQLIDYLKIGLKSTNAAVRTSATKALVTVKLYVGADIRSLVSDLNPALLTTIEAEFAKVDGEAAPAPTRTGADAAAAPAKGGKGKAATAAVDDLFPRVDLEKLLPAGVGASCNDANWKMRKEALEQVQAILDTNKRLLPHMGDLAGPLKLRLADSNKVVQGLALDVVARLAAGMGKGFERHARGLLPAVVGVLADQKATVRASGVITLSAIADAIESDGWIPACATGLESANPALRKDLLTWLADRLAASPTTSSDAPSLVGPTLACLEDRAAEVRKAAQALLPGLVASVGYAAVADAAANLKPASRAVVMPMITAARSSTEAEPSAAPAPVAKTAGATASAAPAARVGPANGVSALKKLPRGPTAARSQTPEPSPARASSVTPRVTVPTPRAAPAPPPMPIPLSEETPFRSADPGPKQSRAARDTGAARWTIDGPVRPDQIEQLHQQMGPHVSPILLGRLFSKDHHCERDYLAALTTLDECAADRSRATDRYDISCTEMTGRIVANVDLVLKYLTVRLGDTNTSIVLKCLDVTEHTVAVLAETGYMLSDYEASAFLPSLIAKLGDQRETLRARVRAILRELCSVYPFSKVFAALLEHGVRSKNARTRAESAEELGRLFQRQGMSVCQPARALPAVASLIADRDSAVRTAALGVLAIAYTIVGDLVYKHVGPLPEKQRAMLDEKLKRTATGVPSPPAPVRAADAAGEAPSSSTPSRSDGRPGASGMVRASALPTSRLSVGGPATNAPRAATSMRDPPRARAPVAAEAFDVQRVSEDIVSSDSSVSVAALKAVFAEVGQRGAAFAALVTHSDMVVEAIAIQMRATFDRLGPMTPQPMMRLCRHLLHTLSAFFDERELSTSVPRDALVQLLAELTRRLLETAEETTYDPVISLSRALNMVLIRIFHNANRTSCFGALFSVLQTATVDLRELDGRELVDRAKYAELVMKCLWKVSKTAKESLEDGSLDPRQLLLDIDDFLTAVPPAEWRRRAADAVPLGDMPLRTVKTILQQVVGVFGERVWEVALDPVTMADSTVCAYVRRLLGPTRAPVGPVASTPASPSPQASPSLPEPMSDVAINQRLKEIFDTIGDVATSKQGILDLWNYRRDNPEAEARIQTFIGATGTHFRSYLQRTMANLDRERAEAQAREAAPPSPVAPSVRERGPSTQGARLAELHQVFKFAAAQ